MRGADLALFHVLAVLLLAALTGCGGSEAGAPPADEAPSNASQSDTAAPDAPAADTIEPRPATADSVTVRVWNVLDEEPTAVERRVSDATPEAALRALVRGPTSAERRAGHSSWFADSTGHIVRAVTREGDALVVDFDASMPRLMPGAGSSFGSLMLLAMLDSTVFQFPDVRAVEYRLDGSCDAFGEWLQTGCEGVRRQRP